MLKTGELLSADVLPKFASVLQREFGPGLQAAMRRAGFQLGTLQVEFEKLLETAAQGGLNQTLAAEFSGLT